MIYVFGAYTFDTQLYELRRAGELIPLGPQVFNVLAYLVQHRQRVVPKQELFERLWPGQFVGDDALERCIRAARRALGDTRQAPSSSRRSAVAAIALWPPWRCGRLMPRATKGQHASYPCLPRSQAVDGTDRGIPSVPLPGGADTRHPTPSAPEGEHKPVTVLCCELAEAKALVMRLGPEAMHHLMQVLFALAQEVVQRYEGTIVQFGGDGFRALFGADVAQEDHARRAVPGGGRLATAAGRAASPPPDCHRGKRQRSGSGYTRGWWSSVDLGLIRSGSTRPPGRRSPWPLVSST